MLINRARLTAFVALNTVAAIQIDTPARFAYTKPPLPVASEPSTRHLLAMSIAPALTSTVPPLSPEAFPFLMTRPSSVSGAACSKSVTAKGFRVRVHAHTSTRPSRLAYPTGVQRAILSLLERLPPFAHVRF